MGILLSSQFDPNMALPLDSRDVVTNNTARDAIAIGRRYEGMTVYVISSQKNFQLQGGVTNADWVELNTGSGGGGGGSGTSTGDLSGTLLDNAGNITATLRAIVEEIFLEDENSTVWKLTASNDGEMVLEDDSGTPVSEFLMTRPDSTIVALKIFESTVISDTTIGTGELIANLYLLSPNGLAWKVALTNDGAVTLEVAGGNTWKLQTADSQELVKFEQTQDGVMHYSKPFTDTDNLPSPVGSNVPWTFVKENGQTVMKVFDADEGEWKTIGFEKPDPVVKDILPLGTVVSSFLTEAEFLAEVDDPEGLRWKLVNGSDLDVDDDLRVLKGWTHVPNGKGRTVRGLDESAIFDPDHTLRVKNNGASDFLGSYQADAIFDHYHGSVATHPTHTDPFGQTGQGGTTTRYNGTNGAVAHPVVNTSYVSWIHGSTIARSETRMKNFAVNFFVKYNR